MKIKRILCPIDFSEFNRAANEYASALAKSSGAQIVYLYAFLPDPVVIAPQYYDVETEFKRLTKKLQTFIEPTDEGIPASYNVELGLATETIVQYASDNDIDLIILATHGYTGFSRLLMGSVAEAVVRKADCPVLAVKADRTNRTDNPDAKML